jgi:hypothetical protein
MGAISAPLKALEAALRRFLPPTAEEDPKGVVLLTLPRIGGMNTYPVPLHIVKGTLRLGDESVGCGVLLG